MSIICAWISRMTILDIFVWEKHLWRRRRNSFVMNSRSCSDLPWCIWRISLGMIVRKWSFVNKLNRSLEVSVDVCSWPKRYRAVDWHRYMYQMRKKFVFLYRFHVKNLPLRTSFGFIWNPDLVQNLRRPCLHNTISIRCTDSIVSLKNIIKRHRTSHTTTRDFCRERHLPWSKSDNSEKTHDQHNHTSIQRRVLFRENSVQPKRNRWSGIPHQNSAAKTLQSTTSTRVMSGRCSNRGPRLVPTTNALRTRHQAVSSVGQARWDFPESQQKFSFWSKSLKLRPYYFCGFLSQAFFWPTVLCLTQFWATPRVWVQSLCSSRKGLARRDLFFQKVSQSELKHTRVVSVQASAINGDTELSISHLYGISVIRIPHFTDHDKKRIRDTRSEL